MKVLITIEPLLHPKRDDLCIIKRDFYKITSVTDDIIVAVNTVDMNDVLTGTINVLRPCQFVGTPIVEEPMVVYSRSEVDLINQLMGWMPIMNDQWPLLVEDKVYEVTKMRNQCSRISYDNCLSRHSYGTVDECTHCKKVMDLEISVEKPADKRKMQKQ